MKLIYCLFGDGGGKIIIIFQLLFNPSCGVVHIYNNLILLITIIKWKVLYCWYFYNIITVYTAEFF